MNTQKTKKIALKFDCKPVMSGRHFFLTQGIPFGDREIANGAACRIVDEDGNAYPTQGTTLATWAKDLSFVKWLLVDAELPASVSRKDELFLEYGPDVQNVLPEYPLSYDFYDGRFAGPKTVYNELFEIGFVDAAEAQNGEFIRTFRVRSEDGWADLTAGKAFPILSIRDANGAEYNSVENALPPKITIEDRGPIRGSICIRGAHADAHGKIVLPYILRLHFYCSGDRIRLFHTFIFNQNPDRFKIAEIKMRFPWNVGEIVETAVAGECDAGEGAGTFHTFPGPASYLQIDDQRFQIESEDAPAVSGNRSDGCVFVEGKACAVAVVLRDSWREYPKGVTVRKTGEMDIELWPSRSGKILDLEVPWKEEFIHCSRCAKTEEELLAQMSERPTAPVNFKGFFGTSDAPYSAKEGDLQSIREARAFAENRLGGRRFVVGDVHAVGKAVGLAKSHELWIAFGSNSSSEPNPFSAADAADLARTVQIPPLALPGPKYIEGTKVLRLVHGYEPEKFPELEKSLELLFDSIFDGPVENDRLYGMIDYGDLLNAHGRAHGFTYRVFKDFPGKRITDLIGWFNNECFDHLYNQWINYLRTGKRKCWRLAEAYAEHLEDVDIIHFDPIHPENVGLIHYHNILHWSGSPNPSHTQIQGWLIHYFLTGNRRAFEVAREAADHFVETQEPAGVVSNRSIAMRREFVGPMSTLWFFYHASWEQKYVDCVSRSMSSHLSTQFDNGFFPGDIFTAGALGEKLTTSDETTASSAGYHEMCMFYDMYLESKDPKIRDLVLRAANTLVAKFKAFEPDELAELRGDTFYIRERPFPLLLAFAHQLEPDEKYIEPLREFIDELPKMAEAWAQFDKHVPIMSAAHVLHEAAIAMAAVDAHDNLPDRNNDLAEKSPRSQERGYKVS